MDECVHEGFILYTKCDELNAAVLTSYVLEGLQHITIDIKGCVSQCYDGASVMSGHYNGVKAKIMERNGRPINIHCHAHHFNLTHVHSCKRVPAASDFFALL
uniref:Uncharacterized protein n=1 Tax=Amphimedon queenslandica TaxID=400682 RepID=A0A1X7VEA2_AMPQE